jgi:hypothetical protein
MQILREQSASSSTFIEQPPFQAFFLWLIFLSSFFPQTARSFGGFCLLKRLFCIDCPGCGLTRSFIAFSNGAIAESFHWHWLGPPLYVYMILVFANRISRAFKHNIVFQFVEQEWSFLVWSMALLFVWAIHKL